MHKGFKWLWQWIHKGFRWLRQSKLTVFLIVLVIAATATALCYAYALCNNCNKEKGLSAQELTALWLTIAGGALAFLVLHQTIRRAAAAEEAIVQKTFSDAITHLGHERDSVILGGVYSLLDLAKENNDYRDRVLSFLYAYIKITTTADEYRKKYAKTPSTIIQTLLNQLFIDEKYDIFSAEENVADLAGAYLAGCNLQLARLRGANLQEARLEGADLSHTANKGRLYFEPRQRLEGADLSPATNLQHANLQGARLIGADLSKAELNDADLRGAQMQQAQLWGAQMPGAKLQYAWLHGANLRNANMNDARLFCAKLQGSQLGCAKLNKALLEGADLRGANLQNAEFQGARLLGTHMQGASMHEAKLPHETQLGGSDLRGVSSSKYEALVMTFKERIESRVDKETDLSGVNFDEIRPIEKDSLTDSSNREIPVSLIVLGNKGETPAIEGSYTKKEAEQWIEEYKKEIEEALRQEEPSN